MCVDKYNANLCLFRGGGDIRRIKQWDWNFGGNISIDLDLELLQGGTHVAATYIHNLVM